MTFCLFLFGLILVVLTGIFWIYYAVSNHKYKVGVASVCKFLVVMGCCLCVCAIAGSFSFDFPFGRGSWSARLQQANKDADAIKSMRNDVETITKNAEEARSVSIESKNLAKELMEKNEKLNLLYVVAQQKQKDIEELITVISLIASAENDSRKALNLLKSLNEDGKHKYGDIINRAIIKIRTQFISIDPAFLVAPWRNDISTSNLTIEQVMTKYRSDQAFFHADIVVAIKESTMFTNKEKMSFFADVLRDDESLAATFLAGKFLVELAQDKNLIWKPFLTDEVLDWWARHKSIIR